jgi:pathogenesis-related protein 1
VSYASGWGFGDRARRVAIAAGVAVGLSHFGCETDDSGKLGVAADLGEVSQDAATAAKDASGAKGVSADVAEASLDSASEPGLGSPPDARLDSSTDVSGKSAPEAGSSESGSGPSADWLAWLTPMNAARAMVGDGPLHWDPIAAQVALTYASQCNYAHNPDAGAEYVALGGTGGLGENIAAGAPSQTVASAVSSWLAEQVNYDHASNQCAAGKVCGHYTQIVWSTTTGVGCAATSCTTNSPFGTFANGLWDFEVCDFSPPGNVNGEPPY